MDNNTLYHYGVKGMKWGVRRYQNKDGTLTPAGKRREESVEDTMRKTERNKKIVKVAIATATVAAAAMYVHKNPEAIGKVVSKFSGVNMNNIGQKAVDKGKEYVKETLKGTDEGLKEGARKAAKAVATGVVMNQTKKALDSTVGKEESAKIFQANDNKKIGKFWKVSLEDEEDDDYGINITWRRK